MSVWVRGYGSLKALLLYSSMIVGVDKASDSCFRLTNQATTLFCPMSFPTETNKFK
jgi:hypothetical protein